MHACVASSLLFVVPAIVALGTCFDVFLACLACLATSVAYHTSHDEQARTRDVWVVRSIAAVYALHALASMSVHKNTFYIGMLVFGGLALAVYLTDCLLEMKDEARNYEARNYEARNCAAQCIVHLYSAIGIVCYVHARLDERKRAQPPCLKINLDGICCTACIGPMRAQDHAKRYSSAPALAFKIKM